MSGMQGKSAPLTHLTDGDQHHGSSKHHQSAEPLEAGTANSHDPTNRMDGYGLADRAAKEKKEERKQERRDMLEGHHRPPADFAEHHDNKPSRGAVVDKEIEDDEAEMLRRKEESARMKQH